MDEKQVNLWLKLGQFLIGTVGIGLVTIYINYQIQEREIEIKEMETLGKFVELAINDNVAVRQRFAEYFSTVSRSEDLRKRWAVYSDILNEEFRAEEIKTVEINQQKEEEEKKLAALREQLEEAVRTANDKQKILQMVEQQDSKIAALQAQLKEAKAEITYPEQRATRQDLPRSGWVYLGEFDKDKNLWVTAYVNVGRKDTPKSLEGKTVQVTANALNVRASGDPWAKVLDVMKSNAFFQVEEIDEWGSTGYFWARISYY